jgi:hypothetical protein
MLLINPVANVMTLRSSETDKNLSSFVGLRFL